MLTHINIKDMALIDSLAIGFDAALNVITGETGAGKSIIIKALGLVTGAKASADVVRAGRPQAVVTATFSLPLQHKVMSLLESLGLPAAHEQSEQLLILRRQVMASGKTQGWINDMPVTLSVLRSVGHYVVDILGQQENLRLLDATQHVHYLDKFLHDQSALKAVGVAFFELSSLLKAIDSRLKAFSAARHNQDYMEFRAAELETFAPGLDDYARVTDLCLKEGRQVMLHQGLAKAQVLIDEGGNDASLSKKVWEAIRALERLGDVKTIVAPILSQAYEIAQSLDQLSFQLSQAIDELDLSEDDLEAAQQRLASYQSFFRKFGVADIAALLAKQKSIRSDLLMIESIGAALSDDFRVLKAHADRLKSAAAVLSRERVKAGAEISRRVEKELWELGMADARFEVEFEPLVRPVPEFDFKALGLNFIEEWSLVTPILASCGDHGADRIQFLLSANRGEKPLPLQRTVSGGELSRIMLAIKKALANDAETCVLVFDEIDTGISGKVADIVGLKLKELAACFQVICISHLAQVAAYADAHFRVEKSAGDSRTESRIVRLGPTESAQEIARILSGTEITEPSLKNARSLVTRARRASSLMGSRQALRESSANRLVNVKGNDGAK